MPEIFKTSYSALDTFRQCPLKYKFSVIDKIKAPKSKEAVFGNKVHEALQFFHKKSPLSPTLDELLNYLKEIWDSSVFQNEEEDLVYFSEAIKMLKNYYAHYLKIKDKFTVMDTETRFEVILENPENPEEKCLLTGIIDRIDKTADGNIEVIDYKTTKKFPSQEEVDNALQLSLYCIGVINRWPEFLKYGTEKIKLTLYFLKHNETITTKRTPKQLENVKKQTWDLLKEIEKSKFEPIPSSLCDWCGYKKICPMWKHLYKEQTTIDDEQIKNAVNEFFQLNQINRQNKKRIEELKQIIESYLNKENIERVFGDLGYVTRLKQIRYAYDEEKLKSILEPTGLWYETLSVDEKKIKKILKTLPPELKRLVEKAKKIEKEYRVIKGSLKKVKKEEL